MQHPFSRHVFQVSLRIKFSFRYQLLTSKLNRICQALHVSRRCIFLFYSWPLLILSVECLMSLVFFKDKNLLPIILSLCTQIFQIFRVDQELTLPSFLLQDWSMRFIRVRSESSWFNRRLEFLVAYHVFQKSWKKAEHSSGGINLVTQEGC